MSTDEQTIVEGAEVRAQVWSDALLSLALLALDPQVFGGIVIRAGAGPVRDNALSALDALIAEDVPQRRLPPGIADERLLGGLDMTATLAAGKPITQRGLLSEADGGLITIPMAERLDDLAVSRLTSALDRGVVALERDGITALLPAQFAAVALDEGVGAEESIAASLKDRLAFAIDLTELSVRDLEPSLISTADLDAARQLLPRLKRDERPVEPLNALALAFGVASVRPVMMAVRVARAIAALAGHAHVEDEDIEMAARLVIAPRATRLPVMEQDSEPEDLPDQPEDTAQEPPPPQDDQPDDGGEDEALPDGPLEDRVLDAVQAAIPAQLMAKLQVEAAIARAQAATGGGQGVEKQAENRGRPIGARRGRLDGKTRLHLIETLRNAAPWQPLRRREARQLPSGRIIVRGDDVRVRRFKRREESVTIFVVDASGSAALHRLAEVKGAVELLLAESYSRRDYVALVTFRGDGAEITVPPTRSLVRAKRCLAGLPGGGGTPLAAGLDAALALALDCRRQGRSPHVAVLTDGQANVSYQPGGGRSAARADAIQAAERWRANQLSALWIDTSPRGNPRAREIAEAMGALMLALPHPNAQGLKTLVSMPGMREAG